MKSRETIILAVIALIGLGGLLALQFGRPALLGRNERSIVQRDDQTSAADPAETEAIERIKLTRLLRVDKQPEVNQSFEFQLEQFAQGATYILDAGDQTSLKTFENGVIRHMYKRPGRHVLTLFAEYRGERVEIDTMVKYVAQEIKREAVAPIIDY